MMRMDNITTPLWTCGIKLSLDHITFNLGSASLRIRPLLILWLISDGAIQNISLRSPRMWYQVWHPWYLSTYLFLL